MNTVEYRMNPLWAVGWGEFSIWLNGWQWIRVGDELVVVLRAAPC